jgi:hypothetical protein
MSLRRALALPALPALRVLSVLLVLALSAGLLAAGAHAAEGEGDGGATWRLEQPLPPALPDGQQAATPIGLGRVGDIEFWAPNRGLLITAGNPPTIPPGVWAYNGVAWHELSTVCGATDGRIAWAGPDEFWTVSDGRPGQANIEGSPPLEDNTLCHFSGGQVVGSYASLAFLPSSYQAMHGAACLGPEDCWFGGDPLPEGQVGAFHLHWNGHSLAAEPNPQGHAVENLRDFAGKLYESVLLNNSDLLSEPELPTEPSDVHLIEPNGVQPRFVSLLPGVPHYSEGEFPEALGFLHLGADEQALWGAADPIVPTPEGSTQGQVTVLRDTQGEWSQLLGPTTEPEGHNPFTTETEEGPHGGGANEAVGSLAAQPPSEAERLAGSESAWLTLDSRLNSGEEPLAFAHLARLADDGTIAERQTLPSEQETLEGIGPKGAADKIACPAPEDCWMATTQGYLFHLAPPDERHLSEDTDPAFSGLITYRPPDAGIPPVVPDAPPEDDSGLTEGPPPYGTRIALPPSTGESRVAVPLFSKIRSRLVHGTTLELRFHLAVKARVRLLAKRRKSVVASTPMRILTAGNRTLLLRLQRSRWPTKLALQSHALAPLPTVSAAAGATNTVSTGLVALPHTISSFAGLGPLW